MKMYEQELIRHIETLNKDGFSHFGVMHIRTGNRELVEAHEEWIAKLQAVPIAEIEVKPNPSKLYTLDNCITITLGGPWVNIYKIKDIAPDYWDSVLSQLNKGMPIARLGDFEHDSS